MCALSSIHFKKSVRTIQQFPFLLRCLSSLLLLVCSEVLTSFPLHSETQSNHQTKVQWSQKPIRTLTQVRATWDVTRFPRHLRRLLNRIEVTEQPLRTNRGDSISAWNKLFGFTNAPWCAIAQSVCEVKGTTKPYVWSARASDFAPKGKALKVSNVLFGKYSPKSGDWLVKKRTGGFHVDCIIERSSDTKFIVIGGNVNDRMTIRVIDIRSYDFITPVFSES